MNNLDKVLQGMAEDILVVMQDILDASDLGDSQLKKELFTKVVEEGDSIMIKLFANHYIYWLDIGRNPTPIPPLTRWSDPVGDIADWCRRKGIHPDNKTVWAILTKIHKYGYDGKLFLDDFWDEAEKTTYDNLDKLVDSILSELTEWFNK